MKRFKLYLHRLTHWEYWSFNIVYFPIFFVWAYYALKARSFFFFNASNPSIRNGGFLMESKKEIYDIIPRQFIPITVSFKPHAEILQIKDAIQKVGISYPCIAKPDIGMKGFGVAKIHNDNDLEDYVNSISSQAKIAFLMQEFIDFPREVGLFYYRLPSETKGHISGVVDKENPIITGDGVSTMTQLIEKTPRIHFQLPTLQRRYGEGLDHVLPEGVSVNLVPFGSHTRGSKFLDISHITTPQLIASIDSVCRQIPLFYFGRLDIKFNTVEELQEGKNFKIIELNGAGSEPTHIYDPKHSIFFGWKEIIRHIRILYQISAQNKKKGYPYLSNKEGFKMLQENNRLVAQLKVL